MSWVENWLTGSSVMPGWVDNVWEEHGKKTHTSFPQLHRPHWWTSSTPAFQNQSRVSCSLLSRMGFALSKKCQTSCLVSLSADGALTACERNEGCTRSGSLNHLDCFSLPKNSNHSFTVTSAACNQLIRGRWLIANITGYIFFFYLCLIYIINSSWQHEWVSVSVWLVCFVFRVWQGVTSDIDVWTCALLSQRQSATVKRWLIGFVFLLIYCVIQVLPYWIQGATLALKSGGDTRAEVKETVSTYAL